MKSSSVCPFASVWLLALGITSALFLLCGRDYSHFMEAEVQGSLGEHLRSRPGWGAGDWLAFTTPRRNQRRSVCLGLRGNLLCVVFPLGIFFTPIPISLSSHSLPPPDISTPAGPSFSLPRAGLFSSHTGPVWSCSCWGFDGARWAPLESLLPPSPLHPPWGSYEPVPFQSN